MKTKKDGTNPESLIKSLRQPDEERRIVEKLKRGEHLTAEEAEHVPDALSRASEKKGVAKAEGNLPTQYSAEATVQIVKTFAATNLKWRENVRHNPKKAADAKHDMPGGSRQKRRKMIAAWQSGKYASKDICAEQEAAGLGMSFSAARKALKNVPKKPT